MKVDSRFSISEIIDKLNNKLKKQPDLLKDYNCVYAFRVGTGEWTLDLKSPPPHQLKESTAAEADCRIEVSEENFAKLMKGELMVPIAVILGKIKISGQKLLATKLVKLFEGK